jgi:callose synthase
LLKFSRFDGFSQAIYLPVFLTAGVIENAMVELERTKDEGVTGDLQIFKPLVEDIIMRTAVSEVWELGNFIFVKILGPLHKDDVHAITNMLLKWSESSTLSEHVMMEKLRPFLSNIIGMIASLEKSLRGRKPRSSSGAKTALPRSKDPVPTASKGVRRSYSATSLKTMVKDDKKNT